MKKQHWMAIVFGLMMALMLVACGGGTPEPANLTITGKDDFKFTPATITVKVGQTVNITFKNEGVLEHSYVIPGANVSLTGVQAGQTATATFVAPAAGEYEIHCDVAGHKEGGMVGTLIVEP